MGFLFQTLVVLVACVLAVPAPSSALQTCSRVDVAFLIDSSGSLGRRNYRILLGAVNTLAEHLNIGPMQSHAAVVVFSDKVENPITFHDYLTLDEFKAKVLNLRFMRQRTRIDLALDMAVNKIFTKEGNTRHFVPKIAILLTDGVQTRTRDQIPLTTVAGNLLNKGVQLYAVGIGRGVNRAQLELLVQKKHHVVEIQSFRSLEKTIIDIGKHVCSNIPEQRIVCRHPVELGFILHSSNTLDTANFIKIKQFINGLATAHGVDGVNSRVGLILYSDSPSVRVRFEQSENLTDFTQTLVDLRQESGGNRIDLALKMANQGLFSASSRDTVSRVAILVTFGKQARSSPGSISLKGIAARLRSRGIKLIVVAIGSDVDAPILEKIVEDPRNVVNVKQFNELNDEVLPLATKVCDEIVPSARKLVATPKSESIISTRWELPWDPVGVISGYELTWRMIENDKGENIINAPLQSSGILRTKKRAYKMRNLDPYSLYKIDLIPQWKGSVRGATLTTQARTLENKNECLEKPCDKNAKCTNTVASFTCKCNTGFSGDGLTCVDNNECIGNPCDANAICTNTPGSFECECKTGYSGDGFVCIDNKECLNRPCDVNARCINTPGSFICRCNTGYSGSGFSCRDNDECFRSPCDVNAKCTNTPGSFTCQCKTGFTGDGFTCTDNDECLKSPCDVNANCTNTPGSFTCQCKTGYSGDGFTCTVIQTCSNIDVAFLIDSSGSLGRRNYRILLGAVNTLAEHLNIGPMQSHAAVVVFSDKVKNPITFNDYLTLDEFKAKVLNLRFMRQRTRIDLALDMAVNKIFTKEGNTRHFVPKIAILLTDGVQTRTRDQIPLTTVAGNLLNKGVQLYAVGIGRGVNRAQLELLVQKKHHVVEIQSFRSLENTIIDIGKHVCSNIPEQSIICTHSVELGFILQSSSGLSRANFIKMKQFINGIATAYGVDGKKLRAGLVTYSDSPSLRVTFDQSKSLRQFTKALIDLRQESGGNRLDLALKLTDQGLFSVSSRDTVSRVAILVTFGKQARSSPGSISLKGIAARLRSRGIKLIVVAIGSDVDAPILETFVKDPRNVVNVKQFNELNDEVLPLAKRVCDESDKNECLESPCDENAKCTDTPGSFKCKCNAGFSGDGFICIDNNECIDNPCDANAVCINILGSFKCECKTGFSGNGFTCVDNDECLGSPCDVNAICTNTPGSFTCQCKTGYSGNGFTCIDNDECLKSPCDVNAICTNTPGSFTCQCKTGYSGDGFTCTDNDECLESPCDVNAKCNNTPGSFICQCKIGYSGNGFTCTDNDECLKSPCDVNAICTNTAGSFTCQCKTGFTGDGFTCTDIGECLISPCHVNANCTNTPGSFTCQCKTGYSGDGFTCSDDDECLESPCDVNAKCTNTPGSFTCKCNIGYSGDGFTCIDDDECLESPCDVNAKCNNTPGSFTCQCKTGYSGNGFTCTDNDECLKSPCDVNAKCTNTPGSFKCQCKTGYSGNGFTCTDDDECLESPCDVNAKCTNTPGSFTCKCNIGYSGDGFTCIDNDECLESPCDVNAICTNTPGSFTCQCKTGFTGDGLTCTDINECELKGICDINADCFNTISSYYCVCHTGYNGNGRVCTVINICSYPMDLAFAMDTSDSISQEDFEAQKGAIIMLAKSFGLSRQGTHTSVIVYGSDARVAIKLGDHVTIDGFSAAVQKLSHAGGSTRIDKALLMVSSHVFSPENGGRSGMPKMLIIITDGQQTSAPDAVPLEEAVAPLRLNGVKVVSVAIGNEVDEYELLALSELRDNIFRIQSFNTLYDTVTEVGQSLCLKAKKDCKNHADIALLVDSSASMRGDNFLKEKSLAKAIAREFELSMHGSHVSLVLYNTDATVVTKLNNKTTLEGFENIVDNLPLKGGKTRLDRALRVVASDVFTRESGMRNENVPKIMFILTDGTQNKRCEEEALEMAIAPLRNEGVHVVAIGVGEAEESELRPLVKSRSDLFTGGNFDEVAEPVMKYINEICKNADRSCAVGSQFVDFDIDDCVSENPIEVSVCDGKCSSGTRYINESPFYEERCSCCYPKIVKSKDINLKCQDGSTTLHRITEAAACECRSCGNSAAAPPIALS